MTLTKVYQRKIINKKNREKWNQKETDKYFFWWFLWFRLSNSSWSFRRSVLDGFKLMTRKWIFRNSLSPSPCLDRDFSEDIILNKKYYYLKRSSRMQERHKKEPENNDSTSDSTKSWFKVQKKEEILETAT